VNKLQAIEYKVFLVQEPNYPMNIKIHTCLVMNFFFTCSSTVIRYRPPSPKYIYAYG